MKTKFLLLFLILFLASASQGQTVQTRSTVESPEEASAPVRMLYDFYRKYMEYMAVMPHSQAFEDSLKRACLTPKAMEQAKKMSQESGADALICAQDASMDGIESIRVVHIRGNNYAVIYQDEYAKRIIQIPLTVEQVDGHYMISDVGKATRTAYFGETNTHLQ